MNSTAQLRDSALAMGVDFFGVADLSAARTELAATGYPIAAPYERAVTLGIRVVDSIVDQLGPSAGYPTLQLYRHFCYDIINVRLDTIASRLAAALQTDGHDSLPIPASPVAIDNARLFGAFSNKAAAHLAGLGWMGRSCLLVTPEAGPRVRWATVLTNAPLDATGTPMEVKCGSCRNCVDACPAHAFTGEPYRQGEPREVRFDAWKCNEYIKGVEKTSGMRVCGVCVKVCPHGR